MSQSPDKPLSGMGDGELYQTLITLQHRCGYILKMCKDTREMRMEAEEMLRLLRGIKLLAAAPSASAHTWVEAEKAKADAYEDAIRLIEKMAEPGEDDGYTEGDTNAFIWTNKEAEWASIKLDDAVTALRERKAKVCHVSHATPAYVSEPK